MLSLIPVLFAGVILGRVWGSIAAERTRRELALRTLNALGSNAQPIRLELEGIAAGKLDAMIFWPTGEYPWR